MQNIQVKKMPQKQVVTSLFLADMANEQIQNQL